MCRASSRAKVFHYLGILTPSSIDLIIYDVTGKEVIKLIGSGTYNTGGHTISWSGVDSKGIDVGSGLYIYTLFDGKQTVSKKMLLIK